jgi:hypothetical protein
VAAELRGDGSGRKERVVGKQPGVEEGVVLVGRFFQATPLGQHLGEQ